jgi:hypothetical protein
MKQFNIVISLCLLVAVIFSCNSQKTESTTIKSKEDTLANYFPVTNYLKGEIYSIKNGDITPLKKVIVGTKIDSAWLPMEGIDSNFTAFLNPIIDSANCKTTFAESKFLDQTINAFTFTYEPRTPGSDFAFANWVVYVDAEKQAVSKIYMVKKTGNQTQQQLTWNSGKSCKIVDVDLANSKVTKEVSITWNY